jgi:hypothetical protein
MDASADVLPYEVCPYTQENFISTLKHSPGISENCVDSKYHILYLDEYSKTNYFRAVQRN